jgi:Fe-S cluster assembly ATP-binding protein
MLTIENLRVAIDDKTILQNVSLEIKPGETHILFGPNGSGKTSLLMTIMGYPQYRILDGKITFNGVDITHASIDERAKLGIGMSYQRPPTIHGVKTRQMVEICAQKSVDVEALAKQVNFENFLDRDINAGFSGGEIKRSELLQLMAQNPALMLFDEPESGVDMENITLVGKTIAELLEKTPPHVQEKTTLLKARHERTKMGLIITHTGYILDYVAADFGHVLNKGIIGCSGNPRELLECIGLKGYEECIRCSIEVN